MKRLVATLALGATALALVACKNLPNLPPGTTTSAAACAAALVSAGSTDVGQLAGIAASNADCQALASTAIEAIIAEVTHVNTTTARLAAQHS